MEGVAECAVDDHVVGIVEAEGETVGPLVGDEGSEAGAPTVGLGGGACIGTVVNGVEGAELGTGFEWWIHDLVSAQRDGG